MEEGDKNIYCYPCSGQMLSFFSFFSLFFNTRRAKIAIGNYITLNKLN